MCIHCSPYDTDMDDPRRPSAAEAEELAREVQEEWERLPQAEKDRLTALVGSDPWVAVG